LYGGTGGPTGEPSGSPLVSFTIPAGTIAGTADVTMTPVSPFNLQALNSYWLVLRADPSVAGNLSVDTAANPAAGLFATYAAMTQDGSLPPQSQTGANLIFQINGVPEPGTFVLAAFGLMGLASWYARRRYPSRREQRLLGSS
jgi:hypothetical protein